MRVAIGLTIGLSVAVLWHWYGRNILVWVFARGDTPRERR